MQHTGVVHQRASAHRIARPPSATAAAHCSSEVTSSSNGDRRRRRPRLDGRQLVDQQVAGGDPEAVVVQSRHDRRALSARGTGHQRDPIASLYPLRPSRPRRSSRCSAAPRRSACDSDASVIIRKPNCGHGLSELSPSPAWMPVTRPAAVAAALDAGHRVAHLRVLVQASASPYAHRDRQIGGADVDTGQPWHGADLVERRQALRGLDHREHAHPAPRSAAGSRPRLARSGPKLRTPAGRVAGRGDRGGGLFGAIRPSR